jgi:DNA repair protein RecO (recombination protein O)
VLEAPFRFSARMGGMVCKLCVRPEFPAVLLTEKGYKLLQTLQVLDLRRLGNTNLTPGVKQEVQKAIRQLLDAHTDVRFKSRAFLDQLEKL